MTLSFARTLTFSLLTPFAVAQTSGPYDAASFESSRVQVGPLAGIGFLDGQDGWILFDSALGMPNLAAAFVQTSHVRSGQQAVTWDAAQMGSGTFGELRRNALFSLTSGVIEMEFDFYLAQSSNPSTSWGFYTQPYPHPQTAQYRWEILASGEIHHCTTPQRLWLGTGHFVTRDAWHHARSVVDIFGNKTALYLDGVLVAQGQPCGVSFQAPDHGFSQFVLGGAGNDRLHIDNFSVRERTAANGLSVDLRGLPSGQRHTMTFRLFGDAALAGHHYALLGSMTGTSPGISFGGQILPLVPDPFFGMVASALGSTVLPGFLGTLSGDATATATFDTLVPLPAAMIGTNLHFAWLAFHPTVGVSEPVTVQITL